MILEREKTLLNTFDLNLTRHKKHRGIAFSSASVLDLSIFSRQSLGRKEN